MRLMQRSTVLLPQPEGPMMAVTCFSWNGMLTFSTALKAPYQSQAALMASARWTRRHVHHWTFLRARSRSQTARAFMLSSTTSRTMIAEAAMSWKPACGRDTQLKIWIGSTVKASSGPSAGRR